jgi:hypothetical protein
MRSIPGNTVKLGIVDGTGPAHTSWKNGYVLRGLQPIPSAADL